MTDFTELIPGLPDDIALECLTRFHYSTHGVAAGVSRRWRQLFRSRDFYYLRKLTGRTRKAACLVQLIPAKTGSKPASAPCYGISVLDPVAESWGRVDSVPEYPNGIPLFCQVASTEGKLVLMGGWDPASYDPVRDVFVYDFAARRWRRGAPMPETRSFFAAGGFAGGIYVAGGHDECKNALGSAWVYDVARDEWGPLPRMSMERDECEGVVVGSEFWVVSGYPTESQGGFVSSAERFDARSGEWVRVDDAWDPVNGSPRSSVRAGKSGGLLSWAEADPAVRVGVCAVEFGGGSAYVSGSGCQGGSQEILMAEGQNRKLRRIDAPDEFSGFVQSGCCVEV